MKLNAVPELKPPATYKEMVELLKSRGLVIVNEERAIEILQRISYYRLTGYLLPFKVNEESYLGEQPLNRSWIYMNLICVYDRYF